jgi:phosphatidylglycerophosphate synthase
MSPTAGLSYSTSVKSRLSDELINTYLLRPIAHQIVRLLYHTRLTPNHVTVASIIAGFAAAAVYGLAGQAFVPLAGLLVTLKDLLDSADGQLARAKEMYSRFGRFLDSVGDIAVNLLVFAGISHAVYQETGWMPAYLLGLLGFIGISLRVSYHVFYQTQYLHLQQTYEVNRVSEEIRQEDLEADAPTLMMQKVFQFLYGWQDRLMIRIDAWCRRGVPDGRHEAWYADRIALRLSGFLGLGTELFAVTLFSLVHRLDAYLLFNVIILNVVWVCTGVYRKFVLAQALKRAL